MQRTTIYLDEELKRRLQEAAARTGTSEASLIREALGIYLAGHDVVRLHPVGRSTDGGVAANDEQALETLGFGEA